MHFGTEMS